MILATERIEVNRLETNFNKACDEAYERAVIIFGIDDDGHSKRIIDWDRSSCSIVVIFEFYEHSGGMGGHSYTYVFRAEARKCSDDE